MNRVIRIEFERDVLRVTLDQVLRTLCSERALVAYRSKPNEPLILGAQIGFVGNVELVDLEISHGTINKVCDSGGTASILMSGDTKVGGATESMSHAGLLSVACAPVRLPNGSIVGVIYTDDTRKSGIFDEVHIDWLVQLGKAVGSRAAQHLVALEEVVESGTLPPKEVIWEGLREQGLKASGAGNLDRAETCLRKALSYARYRNLSVLRTAKTLNDLSEIHRLQGRLTDAEKNIRECLSLVESDAEIGERSTIAFYNNLAGLLFARGEISQAEETYCEILTRLDLAEEGHSAQMIPVLCNLSTVCLGKGEIERARTYQMKATQIALELWGPDDPVTRQCQKRLEESQDLSA